LANEVTYFISLESPCQHLPRSNIGSTPAHPGDLSRGSALPGERVEQFWPAHIPVILCDGPADTHCDDHHDPLMLALVAGEVGYSEIGSDSELTPMLWLKC